MDQLTLAWVYFPLHYFNLWIFEVDPKMEGTCDSARFRRNNVRKHNFFFCSYLEVYKLMYEVLGIQIIFVRFYRHTQVPDGFSHHDALLDSLVLALILSL